MAEESKGEASSSTTAAAAAAVAVEGSPRKRRRVELVLKDEKLVLYSYWRSSCSWRVRLSLALKGLNYEYVAVNLLKGEQLTDEWAARSGMKEVPALAVGDLTLTQSGAILEFLEELHPEPALLPTSAIDRAVVRRLVDIIGTGTQPIQNLRVLRKAMSLVEGDDAKKATKMEWGRYWITYGFTALEAELASVAGRYCFGDSLTLADIYLIPQVYNANRFSVDMSAFPTISRVHATLAAMPELRPAHPDEQPDAVKA